MVRNCTAVKYRRTKPKRMTRVWSAAANVGAPAGTTKDWHVLDVKSEASHLRLFSKSARRRTSMASCSRRSVT